MRRDILGLAVPAHLARGMDEAVAIVAAVDEETALAAARPERAVVVVEPDAGSLPGHVGQLTGPARNANLP
jgi:hypothetical protein